jgi:hypothetical protein
MNYRVEKNEHGRGLCWYCVIHIPTGQIMLRTRDRNIAEGYMSTLPGGDS